LAPLFASHVVNAIIHVRRKKMYDPNDYQPGENALNPNDFISESELLEWLSVNSKQLASMRTRGFPYIQVANLSRMYHTKSVIEWLKSREKRLGQKKKK